MVISMDEYESIKSLKVILLQSRVIQAMSDIKTGNTVDGQVLFDELKIKSTRLKLKIGREQ